MQHSGQNPQGPAFHPDAIPLVCAAILLDASLGRRLQRPAKVLEPVQALFDHVKARGVTESHCAIVAKRSTRYHGDIGFAQQTISEILRRESKLADVYQNIKRALRFDRRDVRDLRDPIKHVVPAHIEFFAHVTERLLIAFKRGECTVLRKR